jgi:hypothetical protein
LVLLSTLVGEMGTSAGQHLLLGTCELDFEEMAQYVENFNDARAFLTNGTWGLSELDHTDLVFFPSLGPWDLRRIRKTA